MSFLQDPAAVELEASSPLLSLSENTLPGDEILNANNLFAINPEAGTPNLENNFSLDDPVATFNVESSDGILFGAGETPDSEDFLPYSVAAKEGIADGFDYSQNQGYDLFVSRRRRRSLKRVEK